MSLTSILGFLKRLPRAVKLGGALGLLLLVCGLSALALRPEQPATSAPRAQKTVIQRPTISQSEPIVQAAPQPATTAAAATPPPSAMKPTGGPKPTPASVKSAAPAKPIPAPPPAGTWTTPPISTEFRVAFVTLQQVSSQCSTYQRFYYVPSAWISFTTPQHVAGNVQWYWEGRVDSGENDSGQPPVDGYVSTQSAPMGQASMSLEGFGPPPSDLLITSSKNTYGYSFRLHIIAPNDVASAWVSVPQGGC